jgi:hypothetical protein
MLIVSGRWHEVYADPSIQAGPLELLWCAGGHALDQRLSSAGRQWRQNPAVVPWSGNAGPGLALAAIVGSPVLAVAAAWAVRHRRAVAGVAESLALEIAVAVLALGWGAVHPGTLAYVLTGGHRFSWVLRVGQSGMALGASGLVLLAVRRSAHAVWLVPLTAVRFRRAQRFRAGRSCCRWPEKLSLSVATLAGSAPLNLRKDRFLGRRHRYDGICRSAGTRGWRGWGTSGR